MNKRVVLDMKYLQFTQIYGDVVLLYFLVYAILYYIMHITVTLEKKAIYYLIYYYLFLNIFTQKYNLIRKIFDLLNNKIYKQC